MPYRHILTSKLKFHTTNKGSAARQKKSSLIAFVAGVTAALPLSLAAAIPFVSSEMGSVATVTRPLQVKTADLVQSCTQPSGGQGGSGGAGGAGGGQVLGAATTTAPLTGGSGGGGNQLPPPAVVKPLIGAVTVTGSITGPTGPDSNNVVSSTVKETVNVTNTNNLSVTNTNNQTASTGSAEVSENTSGGSAVSGDATNANSTNLNFVVKN